MSSGLATPPQSTLPTPIAAPPTACEGYIDQRLRKTRHRVRTIDIATGMVVLAIGVLAYLLAAAVIDQWLIVGGLGVWGRFLLWFGLVAAAGTYFAGWLLPPLLYRINPLFAAETIEKSQPTLKNSLINFLLLRGRRQEVAGPVFRAMESRAAADLSHIQIEVAVDRTRLVRLGWVLLAILTMFSMYLVVSPKSPLRSAARVLFPWTTIEAPTRVTIHNVRPGSGAFFHGEPITVSADVAGLRDGEPLWLVYSTSDDQITDQEIPMTPTEDGLHYECHFPPGSLGLQQDCEYYLAGGDCRTPRFHITVQTAPSIVVDSVDYRYPSYTGYAKRTVQGQGDLSAIEGTEVTLHATSNTDIKADSAEIDLGCAGHPGVRMISDGKTATGHFTLRLMEGDPSRPSFNCYQIRFTDLEGRENPRPIRYRIEVSRDLSPEVNLVEPTQEKTQVAENGQLAIKVQAKDDIALRRVSVRAVRDGRSLLLPPLLEKKSTDKSLPSKFEGTCSFEPAKLGLKAGDSVQYWAEAEDNMEPLCHRSATDKRWIEVVAPERNPSPEEKADAAKNNPANNQAQPNDKNDGNKKANNGAAKSNENQAQPDDAKSPDKNNGQGGEKNDTAKGGADQQQKDQKADQSPDKPSDRIDDKTDPGGAIQEILKDRDKQQKEQDKQEQQDKQNQNTDAQKNDDQKNDSQKADNQKADGQGGDGQKADGQKADGQKADGQQADGQKADGQKADGQKADGQKADGQKTDGQKADGQTADGQKANGQQADGQKADGQKADGQKADGQKADGQKADGQKADGQKTDGQKADGQTADGQKANGQQADGQKADGQKADGQKADGQKADGQKTDGQKADGQTADGQKADGQKADGQQADGQKADGQKADGQKADGQNADGQKADGQKPNGQKQSPGAGENTGGGTPSPQDANKDRNKKPGLPGDMTDKHDNQDAKSPSISPHQSDSQGATTGDRSGGGESGGGQRSDKQGAGSAGTHKPGDDGGSKANEPGTGETGSRPGDKAASKDSTGNEKAGANGRPGEGGKTSDAKAEDQKTPSAHTPGSDKPGTPDENPTGGGAPSGVSEGPRARNAVGPPGGGVPGKSNQTNPAEPIESQADQANLDYARRQTELALEHLRDQLAKEKPPLLDRLGWTKDEAQQFLDRWEAMKRAAAETGSKGDAAQKKLADAIQNLGLSRRGTELRGGGVTPDQPQQLRDRGRFAVPAEWDEQFRAYTRGISQPEKQTGK